MNNYQELEAWLIKTAETLRVKNASTNASHTIESTEAMSPVQTADPLFKILLQYAQVWSQFLSLAGTESELHDLDTAKVEDSNSIS